MALTPGSSRARWMILKISRRASAGSFFTKVKSISVTRSPAATNPGFNPAAFIAPRKNNPAAKSNIRERAICAMTEICRGAKNRLKRPIRAGSPTCCFKSLTRSDFRFKCGTEAEERSRDQTKHERHREHGEIRHEID